MKFLSNSAVTYQKTAADIAEMTGTQITSILVIYAGGTIGMMKDPEHGCYCPIPGYLHQTLTARPNFHDPYFFEIAENSSFLASQYSLDEKSNSPASPQSISSPVIQSPQASSLPSPISSGSPSTSSSASGGYFEYAGHPLITPPSIHNKRMLYFILEYEQLLDSSNMTMHDWIRIAGDVERYYRKFDAFIILHGTDTMSYTASALSFLLENLGKTVIITGSQIPLSELRSDASENLLGALTIAGHYVIPEVGLYFNNRLFRGNRTTKQKAMDFDAFDSPNLKPLARVGVNVEIDWAEVLKPTELAPFKASRELNPNVVTLRLFPGITEATVRAFIHEPIKGIVLETFGAGNAPNNRPELLAALAEASQRGVVIVNCTQCPKGTVSDLYATGRALHDAGILPGHDMTTEAALTKLSYLLARADLTLDEVKQGILGNLRGELTIPSTSFSSGRFSGGRSPLATLIKAIPLKTSAEVDMFNHLLRPTLIALAASSGDLFTLKNFLPRGEDSAANSEHYLNFSCLDFSGSTPLHAAVAAKQSQSVEWLLRHGASIHQKDTKERCPLLLAISLLSLHLPSSPPSAQAEVKKIIQLLKATGASLAPGDRAAKNLLFQSVPQGDLEVTEELLASGLSPSVIDHFGRSIRDHLAVAPFPEKLLSILNNFNKHQQ